MNVLEGPALSKSTLRMLLVLVVCLVIGSIGFFLSVFFEHGQQGMVSTSQPLSVQAKEAAMQNLALSEASSTPPDTATKLEILAHLTRNDRMINTIAKHSRLAIIAVGFSVLIIGATFFIMPHSALSQGASASITGYAWSDTIGWIDLNCSNSGVCATNPFGLSIDSGGNITGYAWSDSVGWISANGSDLAGCPTLRARQA